MTDFSGHTSWTYDQQGHVLTRKQTSGGFSFTTTMSYDAAGRLAGIAYPSGAAVTLSYDAAGRVSSIKSGAMALASGISYLPFGPAEAWTQGNGAFYSRTFDKDGRITAIGLGSGTMALAYDAASRITGISETGYPAETFGYDALDRLTSYTGSPSAYTYSYQWPKRRFWRSCCRRNFADVAPCAKGGVASRTILVGTEVMAAKLEVFVDPAVSGKRWGWR